MGENSCPELSCQRLNGLFGTELVLHDASAALAVGSQAQLIFGIDGTSRYCYISVTQYINSPGNSAVFP